MKQLITKALSNARLSAHRHTLASKALLKRRIVNEKLTVSSMKVARVAWDHAKAAAPLLCVFAIGAICAHAGPISNVLTDVGTDTQTGIQTAGIGMIGWQGMRIYMDEHHSLNPGRIAGGLAGTLFAFAPTSISNWAAGW